VTAHFQNQMMPPKNKSARFDGETDHAIKQAFPAVRFCERFENVVTGRLSVE